MAIAIDIRQDGFLSLGLETGTSEIGPSFGYFPEDNFEAAQVACSNLGFKVTKGSRYLGGFISRGNGSTRRPTLGGSRDCPQLPASCLFWVAEIPATRMAICPASDEKYWTGIQGEPILEEALSKTFLFTLFGGDYDDDDPRRSISCLTVKWAGLAIPDPTSTAGANYEASMLICNHIMAAFRGVETSRSAKHKAVMTEVKSELKLRNDAKYEAKMTLLTSKLSYGDRRTILRGQETDQWLPLLRQSTVRNFLAQEFRDALLIIRYARGPPDLPSSCHGCHRKFSVRHALEWKKAVSSSQVTMGSETN